MVVPQHPPPTLPTTCSQCCTDINQLDEVAAGFPDMGALSQQAAAAAPAGPAEPATQEYDAAALQLPASGA